VVASGHDQGVPPGHRLRLGGALLRNAALRRHLNGEYRRPTWECRAWTLRTSSRGARTRRTTASRPGSSRGQGTGGCSGGGFRANHVGRVVSSNGGALIVRLNGGQNDGVHCPLKCGDDIVVDRGMPQNDELAGISEGTPSRFDLDEKSQGAGRRTTGIPRCRWPGRFSWLENC
jgi:hypothetical protein